MCLVFVVGDLGGPLFGISWNRFSFNIKFKFTVFGPVHSSMAARANFLRFFISLFRANLFKWFLSPHVKHPSFPFLKVVAIVSARICNF